MIKHRQAIWSTIVKNHGQQPSKNMVNSENTITIHQQTWSTIVKNRINNRQKTWSNIVKHHGRTPSKNMVNNRQKIQSTIIKAYGQQS
jgi:hypothetical protein